MTFNITIDFESVTLNVDGTEDLSLGSITGGGAVDSVFGRTGAVVAVGGDYNTSQVTENTNLYFTNARAIGAVLNGFAIPVLNAAIDASDTILNAFGKAQKQINDLDVFKQNLLNSATALVDGATMDLTAIKHTLATSSATRTFTIGYTGDDISLEVTLSATSSTFTFPATALCVSEGTASGNNTCALAGVSGDKYIIAIKKIGSAYYVICKNFGQ